TSSVSTTVESLVATIALDSSVTVVTAPPAIVTEALSQDKIPAVKSPAVSMTTPSVRAMLESLAATTPKPNSPPAVVMLPPDISTVDVSQVRIPAVKSAIPGVEPAVSMVTPSVNVTVESPVAPTPKPSAAVVMLPPDMSTEASSSDMIPAVKASNVSMATSSVSTTLESPTT